MLEQVVIGGSGKVIPDTVRAARSRAKALTVAYSWSVGWGLDVRRSEKPLTEGDLVVEGQGVVVCGRDGLRCSKGACDSGCTKQGLVVLNPVKLSGRKVEDTLNEMWLVTLRVGKGTPAGFRSPDATGTLRARSDDYEATSMRLTPFARAANPPEWLLRRYEPTVRRESHSAALRYSEILRLMRLDGEDLWTVGMLYLCVYLHRHQDLTNERKNGANLTLFLRQEFRRWASVTCDHLRNITFGSAGVPVGEIVGSPVPGAEFTDAAGANEAHYTFTPGSEEPEPDEPEFATEDDRARYERRLAMQAGRFRKARQRAHAAELEDRLGALSHDQYVEALSRVIGEERHPVEAREEAERRMEEHLKTCEPCRLADEAWTEAEQKERRLRIGHRRAPRRWKADEDEVEVEVEVPAAAEG